MAVYKVIQDIESEDKLLGPLTLKSFIYAAIAGVLAFINVRLLIAGGPIYIKLAIILVLLLPMILFGVLASPLGRDQPTEVWLLSHIRFMLKQHLRNWDQSDIDQLVTITAPKRAELHLTKNFSQNEVQSRLQALATTLDSRGWVVKNSTVNLSAQPDYLDDDGDTQERLVTPASISQPGQVIDIHASDDILDEQNNATAQKFNQLMQAADSQRKEAAIAKLNQARANEADQAGSDTRFLDSADSTGSNTTFVGRAVVGPRDESPTDDTSDEDIPPGAQEIVEREHKRLADIHRRSAGFQSKAAQAAAKRAAVLTKREAQEAKDRQNTVTAAQAAAKLELAQSGNALSVASIAHLANRVGQARQVSPDEIEISLH
jgi:hypothetical protein